MPKPGVFGSGSLHWGKLMSKPASPDAGVGLAIADTEVERSTTATVAIATQDFVKRFRTSVKRRFASRSTLKNLFTISCDYVVTD
jgi:hypothetical protein